MKKGLFMGCLSCLVLLTHAQEHFLLRGQTRDTALAPVAFANVMAIDTATKEMKAFAVTDASGNFQIRIEKNRVYELKVTFVGFIPINQHISFDRPLEAPLMLIMKEAVNALDQVTVVAEMPVLISGDTISYKAEAFATGNERKLEDVLEELPGFNILENGDIEVQGKRVDKVLVDGKEFFEGDTKLATKNIPADVVDRVQVLQNFNDIAPLQGVMDSDRLALNIELKSDKKRIVFGDIEAGGGSKARYFGHANTFYYAPKMSINFVGDANNVGELALSASDYFRMSGGLSSLASQNGTTYRVNRGDTDIPMTDRNSASDLTNYLSAFNFSINPSDRLSFSGFLIGFDTESLLGSHSLRTYPQIDESTQEELTANTTLANRSGLGRFSATFKPNHNMQIDYNFFGKRGDLDQIADRSSVLLTGSNELEEDRNRKPTSQTHQLRMFSALNEKNILSGQLSYKEKTIDATHLLKSQNTLFENVLPVTSPSLFLDQIQGTNSRQYDGVFNYYYVLNSKTHINASFGVNHSLQKLASQLASDEVIDALEQNLSLSNSFFRVGFTKKWDKFTIRPSLSFNNYNVELGEAPSQNPSYLFPQVKATYDFGTSHSLNITYQESIEYNEVAAYSEVFVLQRYNTFSFGNSGLLPARTHTLGLNYRNFNSFNFFNIYAGINHQFIRDGFSNNQELEGVENVLNSINAQQANLLSSGYLNLEKRFNHFKVSGRSTFSYSILNNQFKGQQIENENVTQQYQFNASAKLFKKLSVRVGYETSINKYNSGAISNRFINQRPTFSTTYIFKGLRFDAHYAFNKYRNPAQDQTTFFDVLDISLSYRKGKSPWEFKLQGLNLMNTTSVRRDSFSNNLISTYSYDIQRRYSLFTVKYDI